jgi:hypothetical protein
MVVGKISEEKREQARRNGIQGNHSSGIPRLDLEGGSYQGKQGWDNLVVKLTQEANGEECD